MIGLIKPYASFECRGFARLNCSIFTAYGKITGKTSHFVSAWTYTAPNSSNSSSSNSNSNSSNSNNSNNSNNK